MKNFDINWKSFTLGQLNEKLKGSDVKISSFGLPDEKESGRMSQIRDKKDWEALKDKNVTISDYGSAEIYKGQENLYLDINVFYGDEVKQQVLSLYTKDDHDSLKTIAKSLITKMKTGGTTRKSIIEKTMFSVIRIIFK